MFYGSTADKTSNILHPVSEHANINLCATQSSNTSSALTRFLRRIWGFLSPGWHFELSKLGEVRQTQRGEADKFRLARKHSMGSRGAAASAVRTLRNSYCLSTQRLVSSSSSLGRHFLDEHDHQHPNRRSPVRPDRCPPFSSSSSTAFTHSRLFSGDAGVGSSKVVMLKNDAHYTEIMDDIKSKETLAVVYFTAQWCGPCKQIAPYIDQLSQQFDDVLFLKLDVDKLEVEETMKNSHIGVVPTFHFHKKGELIGELTGAVKDKLKHTVESLRSKS